MFFFWLVKKLVTQKVKRTYLNVCVGDFPTGVDPPPEHFVYFTRVTDDVVSIPNSAAEAEDELPAYFDIGVVSGHSLEMLEQLLTQVKSFCLLQKERCKYASYCSCNHGGGQEHISLITNSFLNDILCFVNDFAFIVQFKHKQYISSWLNLT